MTSKHCLHNSTEQGQLEDPHLQLFQALPYAPLPLANFNLNPFAVINYNREYNCFGEFCESFLQTAEHEGGLGYPQTCYRCQKTGWAQGLQDFVVPK